MVAFLALLHTPALAAFMGLDLVRLAAGAIYASLVSRSVPMMPFVPLLAAGRDVLQKAESVIKLYRYARTLGTGGAHQQLKQLNVSGLAAYVQQHGPELEKEKFTLSSSVSPIFDSNSVLLINICMIILFLLAISPRLRTLFSAVTLDLPRIVVPWMDRQLGLLQAWIQSLELDARAARYGAAAQPTAPAPTAPAAEAPPSASLWRRWMAHIDGEDQSARGSRAREQMASVMAREQQRRMEMISVNPHLSGFRALVKPEQQGRPGLETTRREDGGFQLTFRFRSSSMQVPVSYFLLLLQRPGSSEAVIVAKVPFPEVSCEYILPASAAAQYAVAGEKPFEFFVVAGACLL